MSGSAALSAGEAWALAAQTRRPIPAASADQAQDDCAPVLAVAPNDPARWIDRLVAPVK